MPSPAVITAPPGWKREERSAVGQATLNLIGCGTVPCRTRMYNHTIDCYKPYKSLAITCVPIGRKIRVRSPPDASAPVARVGSLRNSQTRREIRYKTRGLVAPPSGPKARPARGASLRTNDVRKDRGQRPMSGGRGLQKERGRSFLGPTSESLCGSSRSPPPAQFCAPCPAATAPGPGGPTIAAGEEQVEG